MFRWTRDYRLKQWTTIGAIAFVWVALEWKDVAVRGGVIAYGGLGPYAIIDSHPILGLRTSRPGVCVGALGVEFNKLYDIYPEPWHARVGPFWFWLVPAIVITRWQLSASVGKRSERFNSGENRE